MKTKNKKRVFKIYVVTASPRKTNNKFIYLHVSQYYQEGGRLIIIDNGKEHSHNLNYVKEVHVKEMFPNTVY